MTSLAEELQNDFADSRSESESEQQDGLFQENGVKTSHGIRNGQSRGGSPDGAANMDEVEDDEDEEMVAVDGSLGDVADQQEAKAKVEKMQLGGISDVRTVAGLMKTLEPVLEVSSFPSTPLPLPSSERLHLLEHSPDRSSYQKIAEHQAKPPSTGTTFHGSIEENPEYLLLTEANNLSTSIDSEVILVHKFIRDHYSVRFPELETLVSNPLDYARTVATIGNGPMDKIKELAAKPSELVSTPLKSILDAPTLMVVTVEATTTRGQPLSSPELSTVLRACSMILSLATAKDTLTSYVQSRMTLFAPNLTALIGSLTAAQLLNYTNGLLGLAKTPACNLAPLGSKKQANSGLATNVGIRHQGYLFQSSLIKSIPSDLKPQALRILSAKIVLAARIDSVHQSTDGSEGENLKSQCLERLDKLTESAPNKGTRALPAPDDKPSRKRGGRRARKVKEATAMTDLRKAQNRMAFGKEEKEVGYGTGEGTKGMGMIGQDNDGRIRATQIDHRTRAKLSKNNKGWGGATPLPGGASSLRGFGQGAAGNASVLGLRGSGINTSFGGGGFEGTQSSIAFTPVQGLELVDPRQQDKLKRKREEDEDKWFKGGTFTQIGGTFTSMAQPKVDGAGFKVPALPLKAAIDKRQS